MQSQHKAGRLGWQGERDARVDSGASSLEASNALAAHLVSYIFLFCAALLIFVGLIGLRAESVQHTGTGNPVIPR